MCSDSQLLAQSTNGRIGRACAGLNFTSAPKVGCDTASCTALAFCRECLEGQQEKRHSALLYYLLAQCPQPSD